MAGRANLDVQIALPGRAGFKSLATGAGHGYFVIFRVNSRLHFISRLLWSSFSPLDETTNDTGRNCAQSSAGCFTNVSHHVSVVHTLGSCQTCKISELTTS